MGSKTDVKTRERRLLRIKAEIADLIADVYDGANECDALVRSSEKWKIIYQIVSTLEDNAWAEQCPLCKIYREDGCEDCPIFEKTGQTDCHGTPFLEARESLSCARGRTYEEFEYLLNLW